MDDIQAVLATTQEKLTHITKQLHTYITQSLYEHDQTTKYFNLKQQTDNKFLDYNIIISPDKKSIKTTYHNKNHNTISTHSQQISRFHHAQAPSPINVKLLSIANILIRIHDTTTFQYDILSPTFDVLYEAIFLQYTIPDLLSIIIKTNRTRPNQIWHRIHQIITNLHHHNLL